MSFYGDCHRRLQDELGTRRLADAQEAGIVHDVFTEAERAFVRGRDMVFLSTVDPAGRPTVSYKGGDPGFVQFDGNDLVFPSYNGNGMFLSLGNLDARAEVGLLFIDFETPDRLRVQGRARLVDAGAKGAEFTVRVAPTHIFVNCPRYIHRYRKVEASRYVPRNTGQPPVASWKRIDYIQPALPEDDRQRVAEIGTITQDEYEALVASGEA